jgi:Flp pilus assembly pilin Flp
MGRISLALRLRLLMARLRHSDESGQALIEYTLILALIAIAAIATLTTIGGDVVTQLGNVVTALT